MTVVTSDDDENVYNITRGWINISPIIVPTRKSVVFLLYIRLNSPELRVAESMLLYIIIIIYIQ